MIMNRISVLFKNKERNILNIYFTAGHPFVDSAPRIIQSLDESGVDLVELGMPYSDPLADGPTIQASASAALRNGMTTEMLFNQVAEIRQFCDLPLILMGNYNQILQYGPTRFFEVSKKAGIDGMIIPDLPMDVYRAKYEELFKQLDLKISFLITPETSDERIRQADELSSGFLYVVSKSSITGNADQLSSDQELYFQRLNALNLKSPRLIGFGIHDRLSFQQACAHANGAIIGSAFIRCLDKATDVSDATLHFVDSILS